MTLYASITLPLAQVSSLVAWIKYWAGARDCSSPIAAEALNLVLFFQAWRLDTAQITNVNDNMKIKLTNTNKKQSVKSGCCSKLQPATYPNATTLSRCSTVSAAELNAAKDAAVSGSVSTAPMLFPVSPEEHEKIKEAIASLYDIDVDGLPGIALGDTVRGLTWAMEAMITPVIQPCGHHHGPFNINLSQAEVAVGKAVIDEVFRISNSVLCGLHFLRTRGYVSAYGAEVPACWSPGDFWSAVEDAQAALVRLDGLNQKLYELRYGALPKKAQATGQ